MSFLYVLTYPSKFEARFDATLVGHTAMGEVLIYFSGNVPEAPATSVAPAPATASWFKPRRSTTACSPIRT